MEKTYNKTLLLAAGFSFSAALMHIGCIVFGASWYRFFGAGEHMAKMAEAGDITPTLITSGITVVLAIWGLYALSGAGIIKRLPLTRLALVLISAIYLLRGVSFPVLMPQFPENSLTFWLVSSTICFVFGASYAIGTWQQWLTISNKT